MKKFYIEESSINPEDIHKSLDGFFEEHTQYLNDKDREDFILYTIEYLCCGVLKSDKTWVNVLDEFIEENFKEE